MAAMSEWHIRLLSFVSGIGDLPRTPRKGRDVYNGYLRGCALMYGNLKELCLSDPVFSTAYALATETAPSGKPRTAVSQINLMNIFAIMKLNLAGSGIDGHIVEFGSLRGGSAIFMAYAAQHLLPGVRVTGFDTFEGMPETDANIDLFRKGQFERVDIDALRRRVEELRLNNLDFVKGPFEETLPNALRDIGSVCFAHIDCDVYDGVKSSYDQVKPYLAPGAYLVMDDPLVPNCLGAFEAMEELLIRRDGLHAEQAFPHLVFRSPF